MYILEEVLRTENVGKVYKVSEYDLFCKVVFNKNSDSLEIITSRYGIEFEEQAPLLEQLHSLYEIMNMKFEECNILNIHEIFDEKYLNRVFNIVGYDLKVIVVNNLCNDLQLKMFETGVGTRDLIENEFELKYILDMKFMEVK